MPDDVDPPPLRPRYLPPAWAGDVVAGLFIVSAAFAPIPDAASRPQSGFALALALLPVLLLPLRRRNPTAVLAGCVLVYVVACAVAFTSPGILLAIVVALFRVTNRTSRRHGLLALVVVDVVVVTATAVAAGGILAPRVFQAAVLIALAAALGDAARLRREYLDAMTERAVRAEQTRDAEARRAVSDERLRIARDLHDVVAHQISVISLNAGVASSSLDSRPEKAREALATIRTASRAVLGEIGDLLAVLRAADGADGLAAPVPPPGLDRIGDLVASFRAAGLEVVTRVDGDPARLPAAAGAVAFRVVQEGLTNALKHGSSHRAHVLLDVGDDVVRIVVANPVDHGSSHGIEPPGANGYGLLGLKERVAVARGSLETSVTAAGFRLDVRLPVRAEASS